jgi:hypothetical protein
MAHSIQNDKIIIGTRRGLYKSSDAGAHWSAEGYFINKEIRDVYAGEGFIYVCAYDGVYYQRPESDYWDKVYNLIEFEEETGDEDSSEPSDEDVSENNNNAPGSIAIHKDAVYICTARGVLTAPIGGNSWTRLNSEGLTNRKINYITAGPEYLLGAGPGGIFKYEYKEGRWKDCSAGLANLQINMIDYSLESGFAFAATRNGLFKMALHSSADGPVYEAGMQGSCAREPGISEIQQAAIEYAEVSPEKIKWMRKAAQAQALMPDLSLSLDGDYNKTIELDRGGTSDPDIFIEGPKDRDIGWGIKLNWDLAELIWSYHQTNIDSRSRLMVQLRNDILDEVTKIYFERLRLMEELSGNSIRDEAQARLKQIRLDELTANIDALTGGYFSKTINSKANDW